VEANVEQVIAVANLTTEILGQAQEAMNIYLAGVSGYLLVAYFLGKDLSPLQAMIITVLFVTFCAGNTFAVYQYFEAAVHFGHTYGEGRAPTMAGEYVALVFSLGILASLKFMWDVRHGKTE
jgi:hypothetical protein